MVWFLGSFVLLLSVRSGWLQLFLCFPMGWRPAPSASASPRRQPWRDVSCDRRINLAIAVTASAVLGASRYLWNYKHNVLHHRLTNIHTWDDDLETRGFLRLSPEQGWKRRYHGQHLFVILLYAINAIELVFIKDFVQYFTLRINPHQRIPAMSAADKAEFWATKPFCLTSSSRFP